MGSGKINLKPLITDRFPFERSIEAFDFACKMPPASVKAMIEMPQ
jgi:D-xylulose reductase